MIKNLIIPSDFPNFQILWHVFDQSLEQFLSVSHISTFNIGLSIFELIFSAASLSRQYRKTFEVLRGIKQSEIGLEVRKELQRFEMELLNDKIEIGAYSLFELSSSYGYMVRSSALNF
jgi:hypothetical protein